MYQAFTGRINDMFDSWWYHKESLKTTKTAKIVHILAVFYIHKSLPDHFFARLHALTFDLQPATIGHGTFEEKRQSAS